MRTVNVPVVALALVGGIILGVALATNWRTRAGAESARAIVTVSTNRGTWRDGRQDRGTPSADRCYTEPPDALVTDYRRCCPPGFTPVGINVERNLVCLENP